MPTTIQLDALRESQPFTATRPVRNSDHASGTIAEGEQVFFRQDRDGSLTLAYVADGSPTNGNQYAQFASLAEAEAFIARAGLLQGHAMSQPQPPLCMGMLDADGAAACEGPDRAAVIVDGHSGHYCADCRALAVRDGLDVQDADRGVIA